MMAVPLDCLTVLTTKGPLATKRITAVQSGPPKIENYGFVGMPDPVPYRCGTWRGHGDAVEVPEIERPQPGATRASSGDARGDGGDYEDCKARLGDGEGRGGFFGPLKRAIGLYIGKAGANADTEWLRADLEQAIRAAPRDPKLRDDGYIEARVADLGSWIEWTLERQREKPTAAPQPPVEPTYPKPNGTADEVRETIIRPAMDRFFEAAGKWRGQAPFYDADRKVWDLNFRVRPVHAIAATTGLGKTQSFLERVVAPAVAAGLTVGIAVPRHKLGDQMVADLAALGVYAEVYRSRDAADPEMPGKKMCWDTERVNDIEGSLHQASTFACQYNGFKCVFFDVCGYQKTIKKTPEVWIFAHQLLFHKKPSFIAELDILGIDEAFWDCALRDRNLDYETLKRNRTVLKRKRKKHPILGDRSEFGRTADLMTISHKAYTLVSAQPDGLLSRQAVVDAGLTTDDVRHAYALEWQRKLDLENVVPGIPSELVKQACDEIAEHNREVATLGAFWRRLERTLEGDFGKSPWIRLDGGEICMNWSDDVHESWEAPTMVMDACLPTEIVRRVFPHMQDPTEAMATMPHAYVRQITDRAMPLSMLIPKDDAREKDITTCANNINRHSPDSRSF